MSVRYRKTDIQTHRVGYGGTAYPAVNVKTYGFSPNVDETEERFNCDTKTAEQALQWAWDSAVERFWEDAEELAKEMFGSSIKLYSAGRSGGWAIVDGLPEIHTWGGPEVAKWGRFDRLLQEQVKHLSSKESVFSDIEANRWAEPNAERYNFFKDAKTGKTVCLADVDRCSHCRKEK